MARRQQLRAWLVLTLAAAVAIGLLAGLAYAVLGSFARAGTQPTAQPSESPEGSAAPSPPATPSSTSASTSEQLEDELAARPMLALPPSASRPQPMVASSGRPIALPSGTSETGPVTSGFPHTPEGAVAQLAAIDRAALRGLDQQRVREVHDWAALPESVGVREWTPAIAVRAALEAAGAHSGAPELSSTFTPLAAQIKGVVGRDFVVACVLGEWQVSYRSNSRAGVGDCQRMVWVGGRWRIGAGAQPAFAPSAWPGSADAVRAGWRELADA